MTFWRATSTWYPKTCHSPRSSLRTWTPEFPSSQRNSRRRTKSDGSPPRQMIQFRSSEAPVHQISPSRTSQAPGLLSQPSRSTPLKRGINPGSSSALSADTRIKNATKRIFFIICTKANNPRGLSQRFPRPLLFRIAILNLSDTREFPAYSLSLKSLSSSPPVCK